MTDARVRRRFLFSFAAAAVLAVAVTAVALTRHHPAPVAAGPLSPGDELKWQELKPYGWDASMAVGTTFTDGLNFVSVSDKATSTIRLISATPVMDDGATLKVLGTLVRVKPDMLPADFQTGWFQSAPGFPTTDHDAGGGVPVAGFDVRLPHPGEDLEIEIQVGYAVTTPGKSNKRGLNLRYEYQGREHRVFIPSYLSICAPATVTCAPEEIK